MRKKNMKSGLLVVDVQNEYFAAHGKWVLPDGEQALERIQALLAAARATDTPVFHVVHEGLDPQARVFRAGSDGALMHPALTVQPGEQVIKKHFPGAFTQAPLEAYLRRAGVDTVIVSGYMTQLCCDTTTRQARERDFDVLFAADATAARDLTGADGEIVPHATIQRATLAAMGQFAQVLPAHAIIARVMTLAPAH
jgi:nicotinamidase-related amidase